MTMLSHRAAAEKENDDHHHYHHSSFSFHYHYFSNRVVNSWNELTEEAVSARRVKEFKHLLEKTKYKNTSVDYTQIGRPLTHVTFYGIFRV